MATVPKSIGVALQYDHLHTIIYKPFLPIQVSASDSVSVNAA